MLAPLPWADLVPLAPFCGDLRGARLRKRDGLGTAAPQKTSTAASAPCAGQRPVRLRQAPHERAAVAARDKPVGWILPRDVTYLEARVSIKLDETFST